MSSPDQARATQLRNIEAKTGKSIAELRTAVGATGRSKHGEIRAWFIETYGLGYGDANAVAAATLAPEAPAAADEDPLTEIYAGKKAHLRAVHDRVMSELQAMGPFETAPKKGYVSLRRKKQFATLGPRTADRVELGINLKTDVGSDRIVAQKPGGMCQYAVALAGPEDLDAEVVSVLRAAFEAAG